MKLWPVITFALLGTPANSQPERRAFSGSTTRPEAFWNESNAPLAFTWALISAWTAWAFVHHYIIFRRQQDRLASTGKGRNVDLLDEFVLRQVDSIASMDKSNCFARLVCEVSRRASNDVADPETDIAAFFKSMDGSGSKNSHLVEASLAKSCDGVGESCPFNVERFASVFFLRKGKSRIE